MPYQIDQSGKIEATHKPTFIAIANGTANIVFLNATHKHQLIKEMKRIDYPRKNYIYKIFASLIYLTLYYCPPIYALTIDNEYPGHEADIKSILLNLLIKNKRPIPDVSFTHIGKKANAHKYAIAAYRKKLKPNHIITSKAILDLNYHKKRLEIPNKRDKP